MTKNTNTLSSALVCVGSIVFVSLLSSCATAFNTPGLRFQKTKHQFIYIDWAPDGERLVGSTTPLQVSGMNFFMPPSEVYIWAPNTNQYQMISELGFSKWNGNPTWSPDGTKIMYFSWDEFGEKNNIGIIDLKTNERHGFIEAHSAEWLNDGKKVVIVTWADLFILDLESGVKKEIWSAGVSEHITSISVSPSAKNIAIVKVKSKEPGGEMLLLNLEDLSEQVIYTSSLGVPNIMSWSPDNNWVLFLTKSLKGYSLKNQCLTSFFDFGPSNTVWDVDWSKEGKFIAASVTTDRRKHGIIFLETASMEISSWLNSGECEDTLGQ